MLYLIIFIIFTIGILLPFIIAYKIIEEIKFDKSIKDHLKGDKSYLDVFDLEDKS